MKHRLATNFITCATLLRHEEQLGDDTGPIIEDTFSHLVPILVAYVQELLSHTVNVAHHLLLWREALDDWAKLDDLVAIRSRHDDVHVTFGREAGGKTDVSRRPSAVIVILSEPQCVC